MYLFFLKSGGGEMRKKKSNTLCVCLNKSNSTKPASSMLLWGGSVLKHCWSHWLSVQLAIISCRFPESLQILISTAEHSKFFLKYILYIYSIPGTLHSGDNSDHIDKTACPYIL